MKNEFLTDTRESQTPEKYRLLNYFCPEVIFVGKYEKIFAQATNYCGTASVGGSRAYISSYHGELVSELTGTDVECRIFQGNKISVYYGRDEQMLFSEFPDPQEGTYLLVSRDVARTAYRMGRPTWDLIFPTEDGCKFHNSTVYIFALEMFG